MDDEMLYKKSSTEVLNLLGSTIDGLNDKEVAKRQQKYGLNILKQKKNYSVFHMLFKNFKDPIIIILLISCVFSLMINEKIDALIILLIILLDITLGTIEEYKTNKSVNALKKLIKVDSKVIRNAKEVLIDSSNLAVGDIVVLESGNKIAADARIIESSNLTVDESSLTGESINVEKNNKALLKSLPVQDRTNTLYAGTSVITGRAIAVVTKIAENTEIGKISASVDKVKSEDSPLEIRMNKFSKQITKIVIVLAIFISLLLKIKGFQNEQIFLVVIALSVSAMPEGLHLALTMALTIASNKMLKKGVIVKNLNAVESLGSCTVIASDKTGTLTVNEQTAKKIMLPDNTIFNITGSGYNDKGKIDIKDDTKIENINLLIKTCSINNEAHLEKKSNKWEAFGDSIDIAFLSLGKKGKVDLSCIDRKEMIPYESENRYSACFYTENKKNYCSVKGSCEVILDLSKYMMINNKKEKIDKKKILNQNEELAKQGYRVIASAYKEVNKEYDSKDINNLIFLGLVAFIDPLREDSITAISQCRKAGIKVVMITGDHPSTAFSIAKDLGIASYLNDVATSKDIQKNLKLSDTEFDNFVRNKTVFSRVTPFEKLKIVESFKRQGEFVAVTGDGVNDAPALKAASIGIAMENATDVAKESASMIIKNNDFSSIIEGIKEGRVAYCNIRKICYLLLSCGLSEVLFFTLSILFNMPIPLIAVQLLWLNVVTDGLQDLALSFEKCEDNIMNDAPQNPKELLFNKNLILETLISGLFIGIFVFVIWYYLINISKINITLARTYILTLMVFIQNIHVLNCRSEKQSIFKVSILKNPFIIVSIITSIVLQICFIKIPSLSGLLQIECIGINEILSLCILSVPILIIMEIYKIIRFYNPK